MEQALLARVYGVADPTEVSDPSYVEGFRSAARAAVDFALAILGGSDDPPPLVPPVLISQARLAARNGVELDAVLRRYTAAHALLVDFLVKAVEDDTAFPLAELRRLLASGSSALDRLLACVSEEHRREMENRSSFSQEDRRAERVERLLAGEPVDADDLAYDLQRWHLGIIAQGPDTEERVRQLSGRLDCRRLVISRQEGIAWAWLGFRETPEVGTVIASLDPGKDELTALGEPAQGVIGWRLTHQQAMASFTIALRGADPIVRYADVALLSAVLENELATASLRRLYLDPLTEERDGGETLRRTLRAYFATGRNISSAASLLGVTRRTIGNRLRVVEEKLRGPIDSYAVELQTALRVAEVEALSPEAAPLPAGPLGLVRKSRT